MGLRSRFAPVTTGPSSLVDLAAGYFFLLGLFPFVTGIVALGFGIVMGLPAMKAMAGSLTLIAWGVGFIWVGRKIADGEKVGGIVALSLTALSFFGAKEAPALIWSVLSLIVIVLIWRHLE
jgi:hypothetical protein